MPATAVSEPSGSERIQLVPATDATALDAADGAVDVLLDAGRAPADILVLASGDEHPWAQHELSFGEEAYWKQQDAADDVFYAHSTAGRAAKRPVAVLAVNGGTEEQAAKALSAAKDRAGELLIVCGDPQRLASLI